ncbi:MAG: hypothetical protein KAT32_04280 [Candidatus Moranbacteria bacterium]|nr:hypothetical protein [Candidatus Moranbacteria bacterium]
MNDITSIITTIGEKTSVWYQIFTDSTFFLVIKIILILYITILLVDIILLVYLGDVRKRLREQFKGTNIPISKKKKQKEWNLIKNRLKTGKDNEYKLAVLEADHIVEKSLEVAGYNGDNFSERLSQIPQNFFSHLDAVNEAHQLRNEIIRNDNVAITKEQAEKTVGTFESFLKTLDVL